MNDPTPETLFVTRLILLAMAGSLAVWVWVFARWRAGQPVPPYSPRRPVPWGGLDVLAIVLVFVLVSFSAGLAVHFGLPEEWRQTERVEEAQNEHFIARLAEGGPLAFLLAAISAAVVAPISEEFLFRVVLQGWLEKVERRWRRLRAFREAIPRGVGPILITSLLFAGMHYRAAVHEVPRYQYLIALAVAQMAIAVLTVLAAIALLRFRTGATAEDLGWAPYQLLPDIGLGLIGFVAVAAPMYAVLLACAVVLKQQGIAADPLAIFILALGLGTLYYRTHRIAPSVVMHMTLNSITLALLWSQMVHS